MEMDTYISSAEAYELLDFIYSEGLIFKFLYFYIVQLCLGLPLDYELEEAGSKL